MSEREVLQLLKVARRAERRMSKKSGLLRKRAEGRDEAPVEDPGLTGHGRHRAAAAAGSPGSQRRGGRRPAARQPPARPTRQAPVNAGAHGQQPEDEHARPAASAAAHHAAGGAATRRSAL